MAVFSVLVLTAAPPGQSAEAGGALVKIDGREALLRSVELFLNRDSVKQIEVAFTSDSLEEAKRKYGPHFSFSGVKLFAAGARWLEQIAAAAGRISPECTHVVVHDGARPAVPAADVDAVFAAAEKHEAVALASSLRNGLVEVDEGGNPLAMHRPAAFMNLLTPQVYSRAKFLELAGGPGAAAKEIHPSQLTLVKGSGLNLRVGGAGDAGLIKTMLAMLPKAKVKPLSSPFEEAQW
jgi:2-C-methyl-D-erythritol 4-phosphate cytidylyltransferase